MTSHAVEATRPPRGTRGLWPVLHQPAADTPALADAADEPAAPAAPAGRLMLAAGMSYPVPTGPAGR